MFISDDRKELLKNAFAQLCFTIFCALFGAVYEHFSHEVYSYYMIYAFAIPLMLAVLPLLIIIKIERFMPGKAALRLWNYGAVTLTFGSLFRGVLDIYGTTNRLIIVYPAAAIVFFAAALILLLKDRRYLLSTVNTEETDDSLY